MDKAKAALASATLLIHETPDAPTSVMVDVSELALDTALQQLINGI